MITIEYAKDPVYASEDGNVIRLIVKFEEFANEMEFGATPFDEMPYGVDLYNRAVAGEFGEIAPFVIPPTQSSGTIPSTDTEA